MNRIFRINTLSQSEENEAMLWLRLRVALLTLGAMTGLCGLASAQDCCCPPPCCPPPCPIVKKICVTEFVPQHYEACRTVYHTEYRDEFYTAYKTECVPECRTRTVTCNTFVTEYHDEVRTVTKMVPYCEDRVITRNVWTTQHVTEICKKTIDQGHWECYCCPRCPTPAEAAADANKCCKPCYFTTKKCWVPCLVCIDVPVTRCVPVCTQVCETIKVTCCKPVCESFTVKVGCTKCVPVCKTETYTVLVPRCVPVQLCRKVAICVPHVEKYTACRMVPVTVEKEIICEPCCTPCCTPCCCCCPPKEPAAPAKKHHHKGK